MANVKSKARRSTGRKERKKVVSRLRGHDRAQALKAWGRHRDCNTGKCECIRRDFSGQCGLRDGLGHGASRNQTNDDENDRSPSHWSPLL